MRTFLSARKNCINDLLILDKYESWKYRFDYSDSAINANLIPNQISKEELENFKKSVYSEFCADCPKNKDCKLISYKIYKKKNVIINKFKYDNEIIVFKEALNVIDEAKNIDNDIKNSFINIDGLLYPRKENMTNQKFLENMQRSGNASIDRFYGYALNSEWKYFITLTTDKYKVDRFSDEDVKYLIKMFTVKLRRWDKNVKYLIAPERHANGALHFHGFIDSTKDLTLRLWIDPFTKKQIYTKLGEPLFEFDLWNYGIATCAVLPAGQNPRKIANYMINYVTKMDDIGYRQKRYYRSQNLDFKEKSVEYHNSKELPKLIEDYEIFKELDNCYIYRKKEDIKK